MFEVLPLLVLAAVPDLALWQQTLDRFVLDNGLVRYAALQKELAPLSRFVAQLGEVSPDSHPQLFPNGSARLAYWINTYNALVLHSMAADYPESRTRLGSLLGRANYFYRRKFLVGGQRRSLDDIETRSIRAAGDPRIHFAIVCASKGCPWLSRKAYTAANLEAELEARTRFALSRPEQFRLDKATKTIYASAVFDWFAKDFREGPLPFIARYQGNLAGYRLRAMEWDWSLNDAP